MELGVFSLYSAKGQPKNQLVSICLIFPTPKRPRPRGGLGPEVGSEEPRPEVGAEACTRDCLAPLWRAGWGGMLRTGAAGWASRTKARVGIRARQKFGRFMLIAP